MEGVVFSHTHWDREWYRTFQGFRFRLVQVVDQLIDLLENGHYQSFLLDGQTVVLDDYLEIRPENAPRLQALIRGGRLAVGPWFVLPDEFLVSGEALVRNLTKGLRDARRWGGDPQVGYLPDMFGHPAQMPQLLQQLGLKGALLWRGVIPRTSLWTWVAPDGTALPTLFLPLGYYVTSLIENNGDRLKEEFATLRQYDPQGPWLYPNGGDHLAPVSDLGERLEKASRTLDLRLRQGTPDQFLAAMPPERFQQETIQGELRQTTGPARAYLLPGILSARMPLKQANAQGQWLLEGWAEPLSAFAERWGAKDSRGFLRQAWRELLLTHPHDSIGGCSIDEVHRDMPARFAASRQLAEEVSQAQLTCIARQLQLPDGQHLVVFNPTNWPYHGLVELMVELPADDGRIWHVLDETGQAPVQSLVADEEVKVFVSEPDILPDWHNRRRLTFQLQADVPAFGLAVFRLAEGQGPLADLVMTGERWIDNGLVRLEVADNGTLTIKRGEQVLSGLFRLVDEGDAGDSYNFAPPSQQKAIYSFLEGARLIDKSPLSATLELFINLEIPESLTHDRLGRSLYSADGRITQRVTLRAFSPVVEVTTVVDNRARDHRLRALFPCPYPLLSADSAFGVQDRPIDLTPQPVGVPKGKERAERTFPIQSWAGLSDGQLGFGVIAEGLPEAEVVEAGGDQALALTLLRAVGWLSRDDLPTRGGGAGPHLATPEAQCIGRHTFRTWLVAHGGDWQTAGLPMLARQCLIGTRHLSVPGPQSGHTVRQFLSSDQPGWVVSAVKPAEDGGTLVRLYNPTSTPLAGRIEPQFAYQEAHRARLDETPMGPLDDPLVVHPHQIVTLLFR